jgi:hypothetical protein
VGCGGGQLGGQGGGPGSVFNNEFDLSDVWLRLSDCKMVLLLPWENMVGLIVNMDDIKINPKMEIMKGNANLFCLILYLIFNNIQYNELIFIHDCFIKLRILFIYFYKNIYHYNIIYSIN